MKILWDFRLFSHGCAERGIGRYTTLVAAAILETQPARSFVIWGNRKDVPPMLSDKACEWIDYNGGSWKTSLVTIPYFLLVHKIDLVHYWAACAPLPAIGMALFPFTKSVATLYDAGIALWDLPYCRHLRTTPYWSVQKRLLSSVSAVIAISASTLNDFTTIASLRNTKATVVFPPLNLQERTGCFQQRAPYFITLGGSAHKNCRRTVDAFVRFRSLHPEYTLRILGTIDTQAEDLSSLPEGVIHEPSMQSYTKHLTSCSGLLFCSLYEGLGLPPLEAAHFGCPLLLSSIPSLIETCNGFAIFVNPSDTSDIAAGMELLAKNNTSWQEQSLQCAEHYLTMSSNAGHICSSLYTSLFYTRSAE